MEVVKGTDASLHGSGVRARPTPNPRNMGVPRKRLRLGAAHIENKPADNQQHENPTLYPSFIPLPFYESIKEDSDPVLLLELAGVALEHYRQREDIEMEVVGKVKYQVSYRAYELCYRLRFEAKFKDDNGSSPKRFFAEVLRPKSGGIPRVSFCNIRDPNNPEVLEGCANCSNKKLHPYSYSQGY